MNNRIEKNSVAGSEMLSFRSTSLSSSWGRITDSAGIWRYLLAFSAFFAIAVSTVLGGSISAFADGDPSATPEDAQSSGTVAEETPQSGVSSSNPAGFTVEALRSPNQVDETKTFFYVKAIPGEKQQAFVNVTSLADTPINISAVVNNGVSSPNGNINYIEENPKMAEGMVAPLTSFASMVEGDELISLAPGETRQIAIDIEPPTEAFDGVRLGAVVITREADDGEEAKEGISSRYQFKIGLLVTEDTETFNKGADLVLDTVGLTLANGQRVIDASILNQTSKVLQNSTIEGTVRKADGNEIITEFSLEDADFAPDSYLHFQLPLGMTKTEPGTYLFTGSVTGKDDGELWEFQEEFEISAKEVEDADAEDVYKFYTPSWIPLSIIILLVLTVAVVGFLVFLSKKNKNSSESKANGAKGKPGTDTSTSAADTSAANGGDFPRRASRSDKHKK